MSKKKKPFPTCAEALGRLIDDVPAGNVRTYDVSSFPTGIEVFPEGYLEKCSHVTVATSGSVTEGCDWMVICPARIDAATTSNIETPASARCSNVIAAAALDRPRYDSDGPS